MNTQILLVLNLILVAVSAGLAGFSVLSLQKIKKFKQHISLEGESSNLEEVLEAVGKKIRKLEGQTKNVEQQTASLESFSKRTIHRLGMHRFNALEGEGGNLSFTLALLDASDSGVVITSIYGRTQNRVYAKAIEQGTATTHLTHEEQLAITEATVAFRKKQ